MLLSLSSFLSKDSEFNWSVLGCWLSGVDLINILLDLISLWESNNSACRVLSWLGVFSSGDQTQQGGDNKVFHVFIILKIQFIMISDLTNL